MTNIKVTYTPPDLLKRYQRYPQQLDKAAKKTMEAAILHVQESVPEYPIKPPSSRYNRTGQTGRSLGASQSGQAIGKADIQLVRRLGVGQYSGVLGSTLKYAPYVIGERTQARVHRGRWWTMLTVAKKATQGVVRLFDVMTEELARHLGK